MALAGAGAGIMELTALAGTAELAPTAKRGLYVAILIFTIVPFVPSVMWSQLIAAHTNWRYVALLIGIYNFIGFVTTLCFYFPPPRINSVGLTRRQVLGRIDYVGGLLSIISVILIVAAIFWGGYMYSWRSAHVLVPLFIGAAFLVAFVLWEAYGAKYPMFPYHHLGRAPRTLVMTLIITFISGANFFSVLMLWPTQAYNVYGHDPVGVGLRGLPFGVGVMVGCIITLLLLTKFRGGIRWLLFGASCVMTAGCGGLAAANLHNMGGIYVVLLISGLGVGGIVVPASIITTIICPDDVIATITALTLAIRVIGGAVGYSIYYNVLVQKLTPKLTDYIGVVMLKGGISNIDVIKSAIELTAASLLDEIRGLPGVTDALWKQIVAAGQLAYSESYPWVYYCSIAFGGVSIIASLFLEDIDKFMDDHIAVVIH